MEYSIGSLQHKSSLANSLKTYFHKETFFDVVFICREKVELKAHKLIIASASEFLKDIILSNVQEVTYIVLPDVSHKIMKLILKLIYCGIILVNEEEMVEFKSISTLLDVKLQCTLIQKSSNLAQISDSAEQSDMCEDNILKTSHFRNFEDNTTSVFHEVSRSSTVDTDGTFENGEDSILEVTVKPEIKEIDEETPDIQFVTEISRPPESLKVDFTSAFTPRQMQPERDLLVICKMCGVLYRKNNSTGPSGQPICEMCMISGMDNSAIQIDLRLYQCNLCYKTFENERNMLKHKLKVHVTKQYKCEQCGKPFKTGSHLNRHMLVHSNVRQYQCIQCNMLFKRREHLERHLLLHSSEKQYKCELCTKSYHRADSYRTHMLTHNHLWNLNIPEIVS